MTDINAIVAHYLTLRDHKDKLNAEHKARIAELDAQMHNAEVYLLNQLNETGLDRLGAAAGTVFVKVNTMPGFEDREKTIEFIKQSGNVELLQARLSSTAVKDYMDTHGGELPPGVKITSERTVQIRRK